MVFKPPTHKQPVSIGHTANRLKNCRAMTCLWRRQG
nr:MAG TPA: hypothetical protein [Caudoviricetes sp.]DAZ46027.1 MAG TPA: hypothetical protein [Caudoviricetes sp.]